MNAQQLAIRALAAQLRVGFTISGLAGLGADDPLPRELTVRAENEDGQVVDFPATVRIDTPKEADYYRNGGILHYVLRDLARPVSSTDR